MGEEKVVFPSSGAERLRLEGVLHRPEHEGNGRSGIVLCHPHSLHGGSMDVPIMVATAYELVRRGMTALRFNLRAVGGSEGQFGEGVAEVADVAGAVEFVLGQQDVDKERLYLMGYSFGASVGLCYVEENPDLAAVVALCLPLGAMAIGSLDGEFWSGYTKPKLFLAGDRDHVCPLSELRPLVESLPEPKELVVLDGADHFLWGREEEIARAIADFLEE